MVKKIKTKKKEPSLSHWDYRVIFHPDELGKNWDWYTIHEVFYNEQGGVEGWTEDAIKPISGEGMAGLKWVLERMAACLKKPVLQIDGDKLIERREPKNADKDRKASQDSQTSGAKSKRSRTS